MLFSEIYGAYYNAVSRIISASQNGALNSDILFKIVQEEAFPESAANLIPPLESGAWPLLHKDYSTNIAHAPTLPQTLLQKQWLKAVLQDARTGLFLSEETRAELEEALSGIEPLFDAKTVVRYDAYSDGDYFSSSEYKTHFRTILEAIHTHRRLGISYTGRKGNRKNFTCTPLKIEYSEKDGKFRLLSRRYQKRITCVIARIQKCEILKEAGEKETSLPEADEKSVVMEIYDERKAVERVLLAFAHFEKSAEKIDDATYRLTLRYDAEDETELVIRILSFGPMVKVLSPEPFVEQIKERIRKQLEMM